MTEKAKPWLPTMPHASPCTWPNGLCICEQQGEVVKPHPSTQPLGLCTFNDVHEREPHQMQSYCKDWHSRERTAAVPLPIKIQYNCWICGQTWENENSHDCPMKDKLTLREHHICNALLAADFCDHFCCGLSPVACKAKAIIRYFDDQEIVFDVGRTLSRG